MTSKIKKSKSNKQEVFNNNTNISNHDKYNNNFISSDSPAYKFCQNIKEINKQNQYGYTPVYSSILSKNIEALNDLLSLGADPNIPNFLGETPLYLSVKENNLDSLILLLKYNSNCNAMTKKGNTALHLAIQKNLENIIQILLRNKVNPNIKNKLYGQTAGHLAIINRLDEDILNLLKECKVDIFNIKDKFNKTPFDYAKDSNDEYYIHLLIKIFKNNNSFNDNNNIYIDRKLQTWNENKISNNLITNKNCIIIDSNTYNKNNIHNYSDRNKYNINLYNNEDRPNKKSINKSINNNNFLNSESNKNIFKLEENISHNSSNKNIDKQISDKNIFTHGRGIVSSDLCSNNIQIKELNNSSENNSEKSKKSFSGFFEDEINNINIISYKQNNEDENNNKENINSININKYDNYSQIYSMKSEISNNSELSKNKNSLESQNSKNNNSNKYLYNNINFSHSSSNNNTNKSNNSNNNQNIYQTNSICANRKIIKSIINDTVKKITVKTISSSEGDNEANVNLLSKDSEQNLEDNNNDDKIEQIQINDRININQNNNKSKEVNNKENKDNYTIETNNCIDNTVNLYENGTTSFVLYKDKKTNEINNNNNNNIIFNNLTNNSENKSINISNINDEINIKTNSNKTNTNNTNTNEFISNNNINRNKTINLNNISYNEKSQSINNNSNIKNKINNININTNSLNSINDLNNNEIKDNIFLTSTNSHIFSELNMNTNTNNYNLTNNNFSLSYSKNLQSEEDIKNSNKTKKFQKNSDEKTLKDYSDNKSGRKIFSNLNIDFNIVEPNDTEEEKKDINKSNENDNDNSSKINKNNNFKNSISSNTFHGSICTIKKNTDSNNNNSTNNINDNIKHKKKLSNGKVQCIQNQNIDIDNSVLVKKSKSFKDSISQKKNNFNKSIYSPSELEKINENITGKNSQKNVYQKHHRQLSYHINYKSYLNNNKEKEKEIQKSNNKENINKNSLTSSKKEMIYHNKNNKISNSSNKKIKNSKLINNNNNITKKNSNKNNNNFISNKNLRKNNSYQNLSQKEEINKGSSLNKSRRSINNINSTVTHNIISNNNNSNNNNEPNLNLNLNINNINNQNKKNRIYSSFGNTNTAFSTINRTKNSARQSRNTNNNKNNIPINNNYNINYNEDIEYLDDDEELCDNNKLNNIPTNILLRLRDWLISCDLLCYYNLFIARNIYNIDALIHNIQDGNSVLTYKNIEKLGIIKPGHIFRILIKLEIDSGIIDNNLFEYIIERINYYSYSTTTIALTSSINDINCCGIHLCSNGNNNINKAGNNKKGNRNNEIHFNDLSSFLRNYNLYKFKGNFLYNGFDKIEYIIIQLFSKYAFNKQILNDCLHVYIEKDKIKLLKKLYTVKFKIAKEFGMEIDEDELNKVLYTINKGNKYDRNKNRINFIGDYSNNSIKKSLSNYYSNNNSSFQNSNSYFNSIKEKEKNKENDSNNYCLIF